MPAPLDSSGDRSGTDARHDPGLRAVTTRGGVDVASAFIGLGALRGRGLRAVAMTGGLWAIAAL